MEYKTEQLVLRTVSEEDLSEVMRTWPSDHRPVSDEEAGNAIDRMSRSSEKNAEGSIYHLCLAVCGKDDPHTIMGWCGLDGRADSAEPEIFVLLDEEYRGKGYGTQCVAELLRIASEEFCLKRVRGGCGKDNPASQRAMEKGGMVRCGEEENGDPRYEFRAKEPRDIMETMKARHSVRRYLDKKIPDAVRKELDACAAELNRESGLNIQIVYDEPECFNSHYGRFENCANYIAVVGRKSAVLEQNGGFYGEKLVLKAQEEGLNTCWVALSHGKSKASLGPDESEVIIIALGYGETQGSARKSKKPEDVSNIAPDSPEWFKRGVEAALLAPTAINQQRFKFTLTGNKVSAKAGKIGPCLKIDLGIAKCHFELAAGKENFVWA